jgi:hypothetical protein
MCEGRAVVFQSILQSLATRVPKIILQRAEEMFPALRENMVSVLCSCGQKRIFLSSSVNSDSQRHKVSDAEEEAGPVPIPFPKIKTEPEVRCMSLYVHCEK